MCKLFKALPILLSFGYLNNLVIYASVGVIDTVDSARFPRQSNGRCILPQHPENGLWTISGSRSKKSPGNKVSSGSIINIQCNAQYTLDGSSLIECKNGNWNSEIGTCKELCPPVTDTQTTKVSCVNGNCKKPTNGTVATFTCSPYYENAELNRNPFRTCINGRWNQDIPMCTPVCGVKGKVKGKTIYPWNAAIYTKAGKDRLYGCTGSLINERTIVTAAHCITNELGTKHPSSQFTVAVGKRSATYHDRDDKNAQYSDLEDMFIPRHFKGTHRKYHGDVAVLITKKPFSMTQNVQPICIDWTNKYLDDFEVPNDKTTIAAPLIKSYFPFLKNVSEIRVPLVNETLCYEQLTVHKPGDTYYDSFYAPLDMYCSGYINEDQVKRCIVDHGVGLITRNQYDQKYYLIGILSLFPSLHGSECNNKRWTLYTRISRYISPFITSKVTQYMPIKRNYFQTDCGVKSVKAQTLIVQGVNVTKGDYPWQVAIYKIEKSNKVLICGGSLLNPRVIATAAHCVTDQEGNVLPKSNYAVSVGKYYRNFDDPRDTKAQFSSLKSIFVPSQYKGDLQNYLSDIAVLVTENSFTLSKQVQPICVDWEGKYESQFLKPSVNGYVAGWGFTQENQNPSEELKDLEVPYVEQSECKNTLPPDYEIYLTHDKICSGFLNKSKSVCNGDSGGGLVFKNNNDERYYLAGIVSLAPQAPTGGCDSQQYALYTKFSLYVKTFVLDKVQLYWA